MAFNVVDPDSPQPDDNAYIDVAFFRQWFTDRGIDTLTPFPTDGEVEGGIVQATDYIDKRFGRRFRGFKRTSSQGLEWPRIDAFDNDNYLLSDIPKQLQAATAEYALLQLQLMRNLAPPVTPTFGYLDPTTGESVSQGSGQVTREREKVGPIETEKEFATTGDQNKPMVSSGSALTQSVPEYPQADLWIEEIIRSTISRRVVRG